MEIQDKSNKYYFCCLVTHPGMNQHVRGFKPYETILSKKRGN